MNTKIDLYLYHCPIALDIISSSVDCRRFFICEYDCDESIDNARLLEINDREAISSDLIHNMILNKLNFYLKT